MALVVVLAVVYYTAVSFFDEEHSADSANVTGIPHIYVENYFYNREGLFIATIFT